MGFQSAFEKHVVLRIRPNDVNPASGNYHCGPSRVLEQKQKRLHEGLVYARTSKD